jgi:hypothetical protein
MELTVHGIQIQDQTRLANGRATPVTHVTFYIGDHGPFMQDFVEPNNRPADIQAAIQQKITDLRSITAREY